MTPAHSLALACLRLDSSHRRLELLHGALPLQEFAKLQDGSIGCVTFGAVQLVCRVLEVVQVSHDVATNIRQSKFSTLELECEAFMINAQQMQDRRV